jgi:hypothetical protein
MAQENAIKPIRGAEADRALARSFDHFDPPVLRSEVESLKFVQECREVWETDARKDRAENLITEGSELGAAVAAGAIASLRTQGGFEVGGWTNIVVGTVAKAISIGLASKLPDFSLINDTLPEPRRVLRTFAKAGKVLLHSQAAMWTREYIEDMDK